MWRATASGPQARSCLAAYQFEIPPGAVSSSNNNEKIFQSWSITLWKSSTVSRFWRWFVRMALNDWWLLKEVHGLVHPSPSKQCLCPISDAWKVVRWEFEEEWWWIFLNPYAHYVAESPPFPSFKPPLSFITISSLRRARIIADVAVVHSFMQLIKFLR